MDDEILNRDHAIFFMDMVGSRKSPNYVPKLPKVKPYNKILKGRNSIDFKRFIRLYKAMRHVLSDRELIILDDVYGVNNVRKSLKTVGEMLNISPERVRQICTKAEYKLVDEILVKLKKGNN
jgi:DNA-directed RNA polymerase sigma subunit (sigma70/sigma32)